MRLQTRFILFSRRSCSWPLALTGWYGVRPGYEDAVLDERVAIMAEQQRERIDWPTCAENLDWCVAGGPEKT